jgi:S-adenosyl methyltransferase
MAGQGGERAPVGIDPTIPSVARIYDYVLGGKDNFEVDRKTYFALVEQFPGLGIVTRTNREFLQRTVRFLADEGGIRQFIDVGSGLPTAQNVHQMAHSVDPTARVVYVDKDPIVLAHGRALLADNDTTAFIQADGGDPASILDHEDTRRLIDFDKPWALIMCAFLHHLSDEQDPAGTVRQYKDRMVSGCYLASSNLLGGDHERGDELETSLLKYLRTGHARPWETHQAYFDGLEFVDPGLVYAAEWRPFLDTEREHPWATILTGGVARKP